MPTSRRFLAVVATATLTAAVFGSAPLTSSSDEHAAQTSARYSSDRTSQCFQLGTDTTECDDRIAAEFERSDVSHLRDDPRLVFSLETISAAVTTPNCVIPNGQRCTEFVVPHKPTGQDVRDATSRLADIGYPAAVVRIARSGDHATPGSLMYAVPVGEACVIGSYTELPAKGYDDIVGTLPGGGCA